MQVALGPIALAAAPDPSSVFPPLVLLPRRSHPIRFDLFQAGSKFAPLLMDRLVADAALSHCVSDAKAKRTSPQSV